MHLAAAKRAVIDAAARARVWPKAVRVWLDVLSVPQTNASVQRLVIASLPTFASVCDLFIVVAPDAVHTATGKRCDAASYRQRGWRVRRVPSGSPSVSKLGDRTGAAPRCSPAGRAGA